VGGAAYDGLVHDQPNLKARIAAILENGSGWNDAMPFCEARL